MFKRIFMDFVREIGGYMAFRTIEVSGIGFSQKCRRLGAKLSILNIWDECLNRMVTTAT